MRNIGITQGKYATVDDEDYDWLMTWRWYTRRYHQKQSSIFYACAWAGNGDQIISMHRLLMLHPTGLQVDHLNNNGLDNRKCNLRVATSRENRQNLARPGTSKYPGVSWSSQRSCWASQIKINDTIVNLGFYEVEVNAAIAYRHACIMIGET